MYRCPIVLTVAAIFFVLPWYTNGIECFDCSSSKIQMSLARKNGDICLNPAKHGLQTRDCGVALDGHRPWQCAKKHWSFSYEKGGKKFKEDRLVRNCSEGFSYKQGSCFLPDIFERKKIVEDLLKNDTTYMGYDPKSLQVHKVSECQCGSDMCNNWPYYERHDFAHPSTSSCMFLVVTGFLCNFVLPSKL